MSSTTPGWPPGHGPIGIPRPGVPRPIHREPAPARSGPALLGAAGAAFWMLLFALLAQSAQAYAWWSIAAGVLAWCAALVLARFGDRGVAAGVAVAAGLGVAIVFVVVMVHLINGHWLLW